MGLVSFGVEGGGLRDLDSLAGIH